MSIHKARDTIDIKKDLVEKEKKQFEELNEQKDKERDKQMDEAEKVTQPDSTPPSPI